MKTKAIQKTVHPTGTWLYASPKDWHKWIQVQSAMARKKIKLNIVICPAI